MAIVIAEIAQNHRGDRSLIAEMIRAAGEAGADYVKVQAIFADELSHRERFDEGTEEGGEVRAIKRPYRAEYDRLSGLEFPFDEYPWFIEQCEAAATKPLTTVFTRAQVPVVADFEFDAVKIASYDCASFALLREVAARFPHAFVSTGATWDHEIERAAETLREHSFSLLHCVTIYPTPPEELHLRRMTYLRELCPSVGFSDHTKREDGNKAAAVALHLGADVVERHFSLLPPDATKDGPVSVTSEQLSELCSLAHGSPSDLESFVNEHVGDFSHMLGRATRCLSTVEQLNRDYYRGRFVSQTSEGPVYNWEERPLA